MKHFWMCACLLFSTLTVWGQTNFRKSEIKEVMKRVADWQIANPTNAMSMVTWTGLMRRCTWE